MAKYLSLFLFFPILCQAYFARAIQVRGKVYIQNSVGEDARLLKQFEEVESGNIINTLKSSMVKIKYFDKANITLGPNTKIIVGEIDPKKARGVSLLNGYIRSKFSKSNKKTLKLLVKTPSAIMGIRGTEFNLIYNSKNKITTALSFQGKLEFSSRHISSLKFQDDLVMIHPGHLSTIPTDSEFVVSPVKLSPHQFNILKGNDDLKSRNKNGTRDLVKKINKTSYKTEPISNQTSLKQDMPTELLGPGHGQLQENLSKSNDKFRPGGYIDLSTGLYIEPSASAKYDPVKKVFEVPNEFGAIDPVTGEYIPPLGLILHPLNGFTMASSLIETSVGLVRDNAIKVGDTVITGAVDLGTKAVMSVGEGISQTGRVIESNTGVVGKITGNSIRGVAKLARSGVNVAQKGVGDSYNYIEGKTLVAIDGIADKMNKYFHRIKAEKIKTLPFISELDLLIKDELTYSSQQNFKIYNELNNVVKEESFRNDLHIAAQFKRVFYKKIFARPRFFINRRDHLDTKLESLRGLDNYMYRTGMDIGIMGKDKGKIVQTYFYFDYGNYYRYVTKTKENRKYLWDERIGFSKIIITSDQLSSEFNYFYTRFHSNDHDTGTMNTVKLSEVLSLDNHNYINLALWWSKRNRNISQRPITVRGLKLNYLFRSLTNGFKVNTWGQYQKIEDNLNISSRGREIEVEWGIKLVKPFSKFFSTSFSHIVSDVNSESDSFDNRYHSTVFALSAFY